MLSGVVALSVRGGQHNLSRTAQVALSGSTIRTLVERQGPAVLSAQRSGTLLPGFTAGNHKALGRIMHREAGRLELASAKVKYAVTDGAEWISRQYRVQLPMLEAHILDYYHLKAHVVQSSQVLYGEGTAKAQAWCEQMQSVVWEQGSLALLHRLDPYLRRHRGKKREALESLRQYVGNRVSMTDYPALRERGYDCGSGPTESQCGTLTARLKGPGMRWDQSNAEAMMTLACLYHSGQWSTYWRSERQAA